MTDSNNAVWPPTDMPAPRRIRVIYIAGSGRSGSTLLMRLLAEETGGAAVGELYHLWNNGYLRNFICGCGVRFQDCAFWGAVTDKTFGVPRADVDASRLRRLQRRAHGSCALLTLRFPILQSAAYRRSLLEYEQTLQRLYIAIAESAGTDTVIDSSKSPQLARMLCRLHDVDLHVIHLVRDSRATAWSWRRVRAEPALGETAATMRRYPAWRAALEWTVGHLVLLFDHGLRRPPSYSMCKYEELVKSPSQELARVVPWLGDGGVRLRSNGFVLNTSHSVTGNPNRFESGPVSIALDAEWETAMPIRDRWLVTAISAPLLKRFGYSLRTRRS